MDLCKDLQVLKIFSKLRKTSKQHKAEAKTILPRLDILPPYATKEKPCHMGFFDFPFQRMLLSVVQAVDAPPYLSSKFP